MWYLKGIVKVRFESTESHHYLIRVTPGINWEIEMKKMTLRAILATTALAAVAPAYAEEITIYSWRIQELDMWKHISDAGLIDGVTINYLGLDGDTYETKLRTDLQSGGPDIFQGRAGAAWLASFIDSGVVAPLDSSVDVSGIAAAALAAGQGADGQQYGVPFAIQMESIIYNKGVFAANNIAVPTTMDEFNTAADALKAAGVTPISFGGRSGWWLNQVVGETMTAGMVSDETAGKLVSGEACFTDPEFVATMEAVKSWQDAGYMNGAPLADDYGAMRTAVALGEAAMMIDGVWSSGPTSPLYEIDPELELGFMPVPGPNGKVYAFGDGSYLGNANSEHADAVNKVLAYTATAEFAQLFADMVGELPAYGGAYEIEDARLALVAGMIADNSSAQTPFFAYALNSGTPSYGQLVADGYQELLNGDTTPAETAQKIQDGLNSWGYVGAAHCGG